MSVSKSAPSTITEFQTRGSSFTTSQAGGWWKVSTTGVRHHPSPCVRPVTRQYGTRKWHASRTALACRRGRFHYDFLSRRMVESQHRECDTTHPPLRPTRHSPMGHSKVACLTYRTRLPTWEVALRLFEQVDGGKSAPTECDTTHPPLHPTRHSPRGHSKVACLTYRTRLPTWEVSERQVDGG